MALTPDELARLQQHINTKWKVKTCVQCQVGPFAVEEVAIVVADGSNMILGKSLPTAALVCANCGNTLLVNLLVSGIRKKPEGEK